MAATSGITTGIDTRLLVAFKKIAILTTSTYATMTTTATGFDITGTSPADEHPLVSEIGDHGRTGNTGTYTVYGEDSQRSFAAQATRTDFTFTYTEDRSNAKHIAMLNKKVGADISCGVFTKTGTGESIGVLVGEISEITRSTPVDSPATVTVGVAVSTGPTYFDKA